MEVLSFISPEEKAVDIFSSFLKNYKKLLYSSEDIDTVYYVNPETDKNEIYFHYLLADFESGFYNFKKEEIQSIREYFGDASLKTFEIQYKEELFLEELLKEFRNFLIEKYPDEINSILLSHPFKGILPI